LLVPPGQATVTASPAEGTCPLGEGRCESLLQKSGHAKNKAENIQEDKESFDLTNSSAGSGTTTSLPSTRTYDCPTDYNDWGLEYRGLATDGLRHDFLNFKKIHCCARPEHRDQDYCGQVKTIATYLPRTTPPPPGFLASWLPGWLSYLLGLTAPSPDSTNSSNSQNTSADNSTSAIDLSPSRSASARARASLLSLSGVFIYIHSV